MVTAELLTRDEVQARIKSSRATVYKLVAQDGFPLPIKIGGANRWRWQTLSDEVEGWIASRTRAAIRVAGDVDPPEV